MRRLPVSLCILAAVLQLGIACSYGVKAFGQHMLPTLTANTASFAQTTTGEMDPDTGYIGTATFTTVNTGSSAMNYFFTYVISAYDVYTNSYVLASTGYWTLSAAAGTHVQTVDLYQTDMVDSPDGFYSVSVAIASKSSLNGTVAAVIATLGGGGTGATPILAGKGAPSREPYYPPVVWPPPYTGFPDPLPNPEPAPGPDPGDNPPVEYPILPPSGPSGPGS